MAPVRPGAQAEADRGIPPAVLTADLCFWLAAALVVLAAFVLREWFVLTMTVPQPNQGDVGDYLRYALHMAWDGTFSLSEGAPVPDAYRSPGYPTLLYLLFPGDGSTSAQWFTRVYQAQALLGAATVAAVIALARSWLSRGWALLAGVLMAVQPHHIAATGALLSEVLFGALLVGSLLALAYARGWRLGAVSGALMGLGALTNPVLGLLPLVLAACLWRRRSVALSLLVASSVLIGGWSVRNAIVQADGSGRASINFVQGAWPEYHDVAKWPWRWPAKGAALKAETDAMLADPRQGLSMVRARLAKDPGRYAGWYLSKPFLLYDWEVRIGKGMVYVVDMRDTILDRGVGLGLTVIQWKLNPLLFALALFGLVLAIRQGGTARLVAVSILYVSAVHVVLQAEPRYAIPYRSLEILLAVSVLAWVRALVPVSIPAQLSAQSTH